MQGFFSEEALEQCEALLAESYDYTRCARPDGSTYGTAGKCRKGVEITKVETGVFTVTDADGKTVGSIRTETGGGAVETRNGRSTARYTASVKGKGDKKGLTLAQAKAWVKDQLGEKTGGNAKVAIKGGLTEKGKKRRLANLDAEIEEIRSDFNAKVKQWNAIPKEERRNNPNLKKNIEYLKTQYEALTAERKQIQDIPVVDHSEGNAYDFTRCVRPDGSSYGTAGKCRKGKQVDKVSEEGESPGKNFLMGKNVDLERVEREADKWRKEANLPGGEGRNYHDHVHVLFHEFVGGAGKIAEMAGVKGKSPTVAEEYLVTLLQEDARVRHRTGKPISRAKVIKHLAMLYPMFKAYGQIPKDEESAYRDYDKFADIYEGITKDPRFSKLVEAAQAVPTIT